jgi:hypothetical protein
MPSFASWAPTKYTSCQLEFLLHATDLSTPSPPDTMAEPRRVAIRCATKAELVGRPQLQDFFKPPTATEMDLVSAVVGRRLRQDGIPLYSEDVVAYARTRFGLTSSPADMLRPAELRVTRIIQCDRIPLAPSAPDVDRYGTEFTLAEIEALPRIASRRSGVRFYIPGTGHLYMQTSPDGLSPVYTVLPTETVSQITGGRDLLAAAYEAAAIQAALVPVSRIQIVPVAGTVIRQAAAGEGPVPEFLDLSELDTALLSLGVLIVGDHTFELTAQLLLDLLRTGGIGPETLPTAPGMQPSKSLGAPQFQFLASSLRECIPLLYALMDTVLSVTFASSPPTSSGPRYELQQVALFDPAFIAAFPTPAVAAESIERSIRERHEYPWARVMIPPRIQEVKGKSQHVGRIFLPATSSYRMMQRDFPEGFPLSTTTHTGEVIESRMMLQPPPGGYSIHGPGELVLSCFDTQQLAGCEDPPASLITAAEVWRRTHFISPADHYTTDRAFFEKDSDGNLRLCLTTDLPCASLMVVTGLKVYPRGVAREGSALTGNPNLRSILNERMGAQDTRSEGARPSAASPRARLLELFPAVGRAHSRLQTLQRAAETAARRGAAPFIIEIAGPDAGIHQLCMQCPSSVVTLCPSTCLSIVAIGLAQPKGMFTRSKRIRMLRENVASAAAHCCTQSLTPKYTNKPKIASCCLACLSADGLLPSFHSSIKHASNIRFSYLCARQQQASPQLASPWERSSPVSFLHNLNVRLLSPLFSHSSVFFSEPVFIHYDWLNTVSASIRAPHTAHKMLLMSSQSCSFAGASIFRVVRPVSVASRSWVNHAIGITSGLSFRDSAIERGIHSSPGSLTFLRLLHGTSFSLLGVMAPGPTISAPTVTITQWRTSCILILLVLTVPYLRFASTYICMLWRRSHVCLHRKNNPCGQRYRINRACKIFYTRLRLLSLYSCIIFSVIIYVHQLPSPVQLQPAYKYIRKRSRNRRSLRKIPSIIRTCACICDTIVSDAVVFMQRRGINASDTCAANLSWSTILMYPTALLSFSAALVTNNHQPSILQLMNGIAFQSLTLIAVHLTIEVLFLSIIPLPCYMRLIYRSLRMYLPHYARSLYTYYTHSSRTINFRPSLRCLHVISRIIPSVLFHYSPILVLPLLLYLTLLLLRCGDVHPHPGPMAGPSIVPPTSPRATDLPPSGPLTREHLHIMN